MLKEIFFCNAGRWFGCYETGSEIEDGAALTLELCVGLEAGFNRCVLKVQCVRYVWNFSLKHSSGGTD